MFARKPAQVVEEPKPMTVIEDATVSVENGIMTIQQDMPDHQFLMDNVNIDVTENVNLLRSLGFTIVIGFDVEPDVSAAPTFHVRVNQLAFVPENEAGKKYLDNTRDALLKRTIAMLCLAASRHILVTTNEFTRDTPETESAQTPPPDKVLLN